MTIAGHTFSLEGRCTCGTRWADIAGAGPEHIGQTGWAHIGTLAAHELAEIRAECDRMWSCVAEVAAA